VDGIVDGIPTAAEWLSYIEFLAFLGAFGALAGFVFWLALKLGGCGRRDTPPDAG